MNPLIQAKTITSSFLITLTLLCFGFFPKAQAVVPAPDGGYPNFTTAEGQNALFSLTTGIANTAVGWRSLFSNSTGQFNTATGAGALLLNNGDPTKKQASENSAFGAGALLSNTTGIRNTANGAFALVSNTTGFGNTANGSSTLYSNTTGSVNTATGFGALLFNTEGSANTATGRDTLYSNTLGNNNTAFGLASLALNTTGSNNVALGFNAGTGVTTANNVIAIGTAGANVNDSCYIGNIFNSTSSGGTAVYVNMDGRLGTSTSSRRFKNEIKPMDNASESLLALKPVSFRYKKEIDPAGRPQFGLVAEDVEKTNPDLVVRDKEGKPYSVRYDQVNAMLLNEFLKEHKAFVQQQCKVQELEANNAEQQREIKALIATVKEQGAQIQKVSAQIELNKPAPQTVKNID